MEDKQSLYVFTFDGTNDIHKLEWKKEEADRETEELVDQIEQYELTIDDLRKQISGLQAREMKLIQCNEEINADLADQIKDLREKLRESKLRERELQAQLERSRQVKEDLRMELEESKLRAIQLRQSEAREREPDSVQHTRRKQGQLSHELLQQLVEVSVENISQRNAPAASTQQVIYQRHPHDVNIIAEQNQAIAYLKQEISHAERKARRANIEAEYFRDEFTKASKEKATERRENDRVIKTGRHHASTPFSCK